jgi:hypothetical protein
MSSLRGLASRVQAPDATRDGTDAPDGLAFRAHPFVCGAIGAWEPERLRRLIVASPVPIRSLYSSECAALWASGSLPTWRSAKARGWMWSALADGTTPGSWRAAAEDRAAAGLVVEVDSATLPSGCTTAICIREYVRPGTRVSTTRASHPSGTGRNVATVQ